MKNYLASLVLLVFSAQMAFAADSSADKVNATQQAQIVNLQKEIADLKASLSTLSAALIDHGKGVTDAKNAAAGAKTAAEEAQKRANNSVPCGGTVSIRTNNPGVPSNKGWLMLTDTALDSGNIVPGWGYNFIYCN